jgi:hypothetical protein
LLADTPVVTHIDGGGPIRCLEVLLYIVARGEAEAEKPVLIEKIDRAGKIIKPGYEGMIGNLELLLELDIIVILDEVIILVEEVIILIVIIIGTNIGISVAIGLVTPIEVSNENSRR